MSDGLDHLGLATSCEPSQAKSFGSQASLANDSGVGSLSQKPSQGQQKDGSEDSDDEAETEHTSRKEKSLGKLCKRFLAAMGEEAKSGNDVHLETVAKKMGKQGYLRSTSPYVRDIKRHRKMAVYEKRFTICEI